MLNLTEKERMLIEDQKKQEDICVKKYTSFSNQVQDIELKNMFIQHASEEQHHFDMLNQMLQGQEPNMSHNQTNQIQQNQNTGFGNAMNNEDDAILCSDLLATEKYVSSTYDTVVFESSSPVVRQAMQHIQQDEQRHGEEIFNYMNSHGMYNTK